MVSELVTQITLLKHESPSEILSSVLLLLYQRLGVEGGQSDSRFYMRTSLPTQTWCKISGGGGGGGERVCWVMSPGPQSHKSK